MKIRKAVFPVAGLGTRFLPATKALPKEMLPVVDKPLIQYAVEEALAAGIEQIIFVTGRGKEALEDHFDHSHELESILKERGKDQTLELMEALVPETGTIIYTRQNKPLGLGHAIWCARDVVGNEPFAVLLADDLVKAQAPVLSQMMNAFETTQSSMVAVMEVDPSQTDKYGIVDGARENGSLIRVQGLVEKPAPESAPSNQAIIGRYILTPEIFDLLEAKETGAGGEIQITDAMEKLLTTQDIYGFLFEGTRFDCGDKAGFQMANIAYAMDNPEIKDRLTSYLQTLLN
ncbi:UTP--glucose-1-phosphate uridylyltransferase GalU [Desulfoluna spongiiphila]|uniref:UTP--glucose-1-phosphate uridylyltransferase n=1 Tax=Desulfoluna spongiiphila TaxID=419481 RepID=A0A1G5J5R6_9BACT|nr:UTP--glucose-1-phosphate uridylyltransferase GalU [Desulfoluna spongiiphila]SCY83534.1 UDP-glucose pyrophosphorylase [Desulfoluna spongiiphila]VVS92989.1 nucleotide-diphospho-sugar transferases [Desulfoluna spongiiphila]